MPEEPTDQFADPAKLATVLGAIEALGRAVNREREKVPAEQSPSSERIYSPLLDREDTSVAFTNRRGGVIAVIRPTGGGRSARSSPASSRAGYRQSSMSQSLRSASARDQAQSPPVWPASVAFALFVAAFIGMVGLALFDASSTPSMTEPHPLEAVPFWITSDEEADDNTAQQPSEAENEWNTSSLNGRQQQLTDPTNAKPVARPKQTSKNSFFVSTISG